MCEIIEDDQPVLPTRKEAIRSLAEQEVDTYCPHYKLSGDPALDRQNMLKLPMLSKELNMNTATWSSENQGCHVRAVRKCDSVFLNLIHFT